MRYILTLFVLAFAAATIFKLELLSVEATLIGFAIVVLVWSLTHPFHPINKELVDWAYYSLGLFGVVLFFLSDTDTRARHSAAVELVRSQRTSEYLLLDIQQLQAVLDDPDSAFSVLKDELPNIVTQRRSLARNARNLYKEEGVTPDTPLLGSIYEGNDEMDGATDTWEWLATVDDLNDLKFDKFAAITAERNLRAFPPRVEFAGGSCSPSWLLGCVRKAVLDPDALSRDFETLVADYKTLEKKRQGLRGLVEGGDAATFPQLSEHLSYGWPFVLVMMLGAKIGRTNSRELLAKIKKELAEAEASSSQEDRDVDAP